MSSREVRVGDAVLHPAHGEVKGSVVEVDGEPFYRIEGVDRMPPFFVTVVSDSDHWMFASSTGALTAGRRNVEGSLFPYVTEDKVHDSADLTGPKTLILADRGEATSLWEPFSPRFAGAYRIRRDLYKSVLGNQLVFEERNLDLALTFRYRWAFSDDFGFVRHARLANEGAAEVQVRLLDGLQNLLPAGVDPGMQTELSVLVDAYRKSELDVRTGLGIYSLSSIPVDKPEPSEALRANTVWSSVDAAGPRLLSSAQLDAFRMGQAPAPETDRRAARGAYFVFLEEALRESASADWYLVADVNQGPAAVASLVERLSGSPPSGEALEADIECGSDRLRSIIGTADGLQVTSDPLSDARHSANVLFNVMRGGIYADGHFVDREDLRAFVTHHNREVAAAHEDFLSDLPERLDVGSLRARAASVGDPQLRRLCTEYLPLTFSRRHGDPSRPWNRFSIETRGQGGGRGLDYEGNWRDIFQNWEALSVSYPAFLEGVIAKFLNASTPDGHNPYRITRGGIDWEVYDPSDPWSFIGYWGDHQIIYLLRLLELARTHEPGLLVEMLGSRRFAYANVPYRIRGYEELLADPYHTIDFDDELAAEIDGRVAELGADGKLVQDTEGHVRLVNLTEKLLVTLLAKLANFVPEAGIWMNTQRPEWNDANNALVGRGVSMVTLYHIRRFLSFLRDLYQKAELAEAAVRSEVAALTRSVAATMREHEAALDAPLDDGTRRAVLDGVGRAGEAYRMAVYAAPGGADEAALSRSELLSFFELALHWVDHSIAANRRDDGLYHSYNLIDSMGEDALPIGTMHEMLEGQVAVLNAGVLSSEEASDLLDALRRSRLYREDQHSYLLYPDVERPPFLERGVIGPEAAGRSRLIRELLAQGDTTLVEADSSGMPYFAGGLRNAHDVGAALDALSHSGWAELVASERELILELWEACFHHRSYTGRSGTFYGYEGLGSIYWHMVSKLRLAVAEVYHRGASTGTDEATLRHLADRYFEILEGLGVHESPKVHGAFPTDPYSHTPGGGGARQPGLTGQVKEDILARWAELGVTVEGGVIRFSPALLRRDEFLRSPRTFRWVHPDGALRSLDLDIGTLAFTYCQTPVVYHLSDSSAVSVTRAGVEERLEGLTLTPEASGEILGRSGGVERVDVFLSPRR